MIRDEEHESCCLLFVKRVDINRIPQAGRVTLPYELGTLLGRIGLV